MISKRISTFTRTKKLIFFKKNIPELKKTFVPLFIYAFIISITLVIGSYFVNGFIDKKTIFYNEILIITLLNSINLILYKEVIIRWILNLIVLYLFSIVFILNLYTIKFTGTVISIDTFVIYFNDFVSKQNVYLVVSGLILMLLILILTLKKFEKLLFNHQTTLVEFLVLITFFIISAYLIVGKEIHKKTNISILSNYSKKLFDGFMYPIDENLISSRYNLENKLYSKQQNISINKDIYLIVMDDVRKDHMSLYGYNRKTTPFLDSLISEKQISKKSNFYSNSSETVYSLLNLFYSRQAGRINLNDLKLNDCLKKGLELRTFNFTTGEPDEWDGWKGSKKIISNWDYIFSAHEAKNNENIDFSVLKKLKDLSSNKIKNKFVFIHFNVCHILGKLDDKYKFFLPSNWWQLMQFQNESNINLAINEYDNRIIQQDDELRQFYNDLKIKGQLNNSIFIITSDHGESFLESRPLGKKVGHGDYLYNENIGVPFIYFGFKLPNVASHSTIIDLAPTILDLMDLKAPSFWEGHTLIKPKEFNLSFHQSFYQNAVIYSDKKSKIKYVVEKATGKAYLFDLFLDKNENNNILNNGKYTNELNQIQLFLKKKTNLI